MGGFDLAINEIAKVGKVVSIAENNERNNAERQQS